MKAANVTGCTCLNYDDDHDKIPSLAGAELNMKGLELSAETTSGIVAGLRKWRGSGLSVDLRQNFLGNEPLEAVVEAMDAKVTLPTWGKCWGEDGYEDIGVREAESLGCGKMGYLVEFRSSDRAYANMSVFREYHACTSSCKRHVDIVD